MCNKLHSDSKPIKKEGVGWKIFSFAWELGRPTRTYLLPLTISIPYICKDNSVKFSSVYGDDEKHVGFCFFLTKKGATKAMREWNRGCMIEGFDPTSPVVVKIKYSGGLGKHIESNFIESAVTIALCREFSIHPDEKYKLA